jgi:hypothetical protein
MSSARRRASIGFRAKTGRAIVVALAESLRIPELVHRGEVSLVDPRVPDSGGPYHAVMELPWAEAQAAVRDLISVLERSATDVVASQIRELTARRFDVVGIGIVGSPDRRLERIGSSHIRAHAAEGILFRNILEVAATANGIPHRALSDRSFSEFASSEFSARDIRIADALKAMGRAAGPPWRTDEKAAATAAWLTLAE